MVRKFIGRLLFVAIIIGLVLSSVGCASNTTPITGPNPFLGTWSGGIHGTIVFKADGTGKQAGTKFTYTVDGNNAQITVRAGLKATVTAVIADDGSLIFQGVTFKKKG